MRIKDIIVKEREYIIRSLDEDLSRYLNKPRFRSIADFQILFESYMFGSLGYLLSCESRYSDKAKVAITVMYLEVKKQYYDDLLFEYDADSFSYIIRGRKGDLK